MSNTITEAQERWRPCVTHFVLSGILICVHLYLFVCCDAECVGRQEGTPKQERTCPCDRQEGTPLQERTCPFDTYRKYNILLVCCLFIC